MQTGFSEVEFLRRRSGTVSSLISKFAGGITAGDNVAFSTGKRENRRNTIIGMASVPPPSCSFGQRRDRSNSGAFLANVLARRVSEDKANTVSDVAQRNVAQRRTTFHESRDSRLICPKHSCNYCLFHKTGCYITYWLF